MLAARRKREGWEGRWFEGGGRRQVRELEQRLEQSQEELSRMAAEYAHKLEGERTRAATELEAQATRHELERAQVSPPPSPSPSLVTLCATQTSQIFV